MHLAQLVDADGHGEPVLYCHSHELEQILLMNDHITAAEALIAKTSHSRGAGRPADNVALLAALLAIHDTLIAIEANLNLNLKPEPEPDTVVASGAATVMATGAISVSQVATPQVEVSAPQRRGRPALQ